MTAPKPQVSTFNVLLAGGLMFTLLGLMMDVQVNQPQAEEVRDFLGCEGDVRAEVVLSREQLAQVLTVPERDSRDKVRQILAEPYCVLPSVEVRYGVKAEREVYPLAFDPTAWLVILFEGDEYAGYRISVQS